ncbi:MAG: hypothetical protein J6S50_05745 [Oscillospiraceae bacterium]|nr:hypothetical protein [Lachnospiraceae bacterium]MBO7727998.1 hypothetical protein [Oscillospiraceae bacterium]
MSNVIKKQTALNALRDIYKRLWDIDIPSPTVPEYVEHHKQIQEIMKYTNEWIEKLQALEADNDLISRKDAVEAIRNKKVPVKLAFSMSYNMGVDDCATTLEYMPGV